MTFFSFVINFDPDLATLGISLPSTTPSTHLSLIGERDCTIKAIFPSKQAMAMQNLHFPSMPPNPTADISIGFREYFYRSSPGMAFL
jgi:hypothetical protein